MSTKANRPSLRYFKLFVRDKGRPTIAVLEYVMTNIDLINDMGVKIKIAKLSDDDLDKEMVTTLNNRGILRFPAMVTDENKVKLGVKKITSLFEGNKASYQKYLVSQQPPSKSAIFLQDFAEDPGLAQFYQREMSLDAMQKDTEIGEKEGFEGGASEEFSRRVSDQLTQRNIAPGGKAADFDMESIMSRRQGLSSPARVKSTTPRRAMPLADNIATNDSVVKSSLSAPRTNGANGQFDDSMFDRAFMEGMEGIGGDYY